MNKQTTKRLVRAYQRVFDAREILLEEVISANENGNSVVDIAKAVGVSHQTITNWIEGHTTPFNTRAR